MRGAGRWFLRVFPIQEYRAATGGMPGVHISGPISDHPATVKIDAQGCSGVKEHAGLGFASPVVWVKSSLPWGVADFDAVERWYKFEQAGMHGFDYDLRLRSAANIRLIGGDHEYEAAETL